MHALCAMVASGIVLVAGAQAASGQRGTVATPRQLAQRAMEKPITVAFEDARLEDVAGFIETYAEIRVRGMWQDERHISGLDREVRVSVDIREGTVRDLLDEVLEEASEGFDEATWQVSARGELQVGPRGRLNRYRETVIYDVSDLLMRLPDFDDAPVIDIDAALQQGSGSGGGGGSIIDGYDSDEDPDLGDAEDLAGELSTLIRDLVESEQWRVNGGDGGLIRVHEGYLVIRAPEYIHRQLRGSSVN